MMENEQSSLSKLGNNLVEEMGSGAICSIPFFLAALIALAFSNETLCLWLLVFGGLANVFGSVIAILLWEKKQG
jgi:hypothetical protein